MDFKYSVEQEMLTDSLRRLGKNVWSFQQRRQRQEAGALDQGAWQQLAELGVLGLTIPEEFDGFGEGASSLLAIHMELGRSLVAEPVISSSVHGAGILRQIDNVLGQQLLRQLASGEKVCSVALREAAKVDDVSNLATQANQEGDNYILSGQKHAVSWGAQADYLIVSAQLDSELALFLVARDSEGVSVKDYPTMDGMRSAVVDLERVAVGKESLLAVGAEAKQVLLRAEQEALTALCAQAVGMMEQLLESTIEYVQTRQQFAKPLSTFQVIQHRLADMYIHLEEAKAMAFVATQALGLTDDGERQRRISASKIKVAKAAQFIAESAIQLHGGMGMTDELEVGDFFKRLTFVEFHFGDTPSHLSKLAALK